MLLPRKILVPTDFGDAATEAVDYAIGLARALGSEVVLLHAFDIPAVGYPDGTLIATADMTTRVLESAQIGLQRQVSDYESSGVPLRSVVKQGDAWRSIVNTADELDVDMIVMGTHGRRGLPRALLGSVAEKVVRAAHVPVLTVHAGGRAARAEMPLAHDRDEQPAMTPPAVESSRH